MATITALGIGSGLDLTGLLDQLEAAERQKLVPIAQQKQSYQSKISAYGVLQNALNQFQTAADKLKDGQLFSAVKSSVTGSSVTAASSSDAAAGVYQVNVERLATHYSVATEGVDDKSKPLGAGTISFTFPGAEGEGGSAKPVVIEEGKTSLEDIRNAINAADIGESPRVPRRLHYLREWSHDQIKQVFPRGSRACGATGARASGRVSIALGGR